MNQINVNELKRLANELDGAKNGHARAKALVEALELSSGKTSVVLNLKTKRFDAASRGEDQDQGFSLVVSDNYTPARVAAGREQLLKHMRSFAREQLIAWDSKIEGLEFQIRKLTKA